MQLEALFARLEADKAQVYNLPDSEFSDAYLSFRRRTEETVKAFVADTLNVPGAKLGDMLVWLGEKLAQWTPESIRNLCSQYLNILFAGAEGVQTIPRDNQTYTLDPAPFKEMTAVILAKSRPDHEHKSDAESHIQNLEKLKDFARSVVPIVAAFGVSEACVSMMLWKGASDILDTIKPTTEASSVKKEVILESIEVKKTGTVIIASYRYNFTGRIDKGCCWDDSLVKLGIHVRVWKFPIMADLKQEYLRLCSASKK